MKILCPLALRGGGAHPFLPMNAASFTLTPLGRAVLHLECLCHHPAAARFYFTGLRRNLREWTRATAKSGAIP